MDDDAILLRLNLIIALLGCILAILLFPMLSLEWLFLGLMLVGLGVPILIFILVLLR